MPQYDEAVLKEAAEKQTGNPTAIYTRTEEEIAARKFVTPPAPEIPVAAKVAAPVAKLIKSKSKTSATKKSVVPAKVKTAIKIVKPIVKPILKPASTGGYHKP